MTAHPSDFSPPTATQLAQQQIQQRTNRLMDIANGASANRLGQLQAQHANAATQQQMSMLQAQQFMNQNAAQQVLKPLPALEILELTAEQLDAITGVP